MIIFRKILILLVILIINNNYTTNKNIKNENNNSNKNIKKNSNNIKNNHNNNKKLIKTIIIIKLIIKGKENIILLGESMLRNINGYRLSKLIKYKFNVKSRFYLGAGVRCMEDHVKRTVPNGEANQIELHVGRNDLVKDKKQMQNIY